MSLEQPHITLRPVCFKELPRRVYFIDGIPRQDLCILFIVFINHLNQVHGLGFHHL